MLRDNVWFHVKNHDWIECYRSLRYEEDDYGTKQSEKLEIIGLDDLTIDELTDTIQRMEKLQVMMA